MGLASLEEIKSLNHLAIDDRVMQKSDSELLQLPQVPSLLIVGNKLTPQDETRIRKLWPEARVESGITGDTGENYIRVWDRAGSRLSGTPAELDDDL
jgi:hypothetical protein